MVLDLCDGGPCLGTESGRVPSQTPELLWLTLSGKAVDEFLTRPHQDSIAHLRLRQVTLNLLQDIREFLQAPHLVQEILSAQKTPTLSMALPGYEKLLVLLRLLKRKLWRIAHGIDASITKIEEYLQKARHENDVYVIAIGTPSLRHSTILMLTYYNLHSVEPHNEVSVGHNALGSTGSESRSKNRARSGELYHSSFYFE